MSMTGRAISTPFPDQTTHALISNAHEIGEKMRNKKLKETEKLNFIKTMPPLYHQLPNQDFDIRKSEVVKWLIQQPEILQKVFDFAANRSPKNKLVEYNSQTGQWQGIDFKQKEEGEK